MPQTENARKPSKARLVIYWILTGYLAFESVLSATWDFNWLNKGFAIAIMRQIGFPSYFLVIKGVATLLAAPIFVLPGLRLLKEWAYFGTFLIYVGAIASHLAVGDGFKPLIAPIIFLSITVGSWALRPDSRKFKISQAAGLLIF
jgi:DoxX-like family